MEKPMPELNYDTAVNYLPNLSQKLPIQDDKFLFFFNPEIVDAKFLFGLPLKTGVFIFSVVALIQALNAFFEVFKPNSFWIFIVSIIAFLIYFIIAFYAFVGALQNNYSFVKLSYSIIAVLFLIEALRYVCKSLYKTIEFITPWDGDFLKLDFLVYVFGYGVYLFIYLYLIFLLYRFMIQVKNGGSANLNNVDNEEQEHIIPQEDIEKKNE
jgi:hypothetical protein